MDYVVGVLGFSKAQKYSAEKTSCILDLSWHLFEDTKAGALSFDQSFALFKQFLLRHALDRPPHSIDLFTLQEVKVVTDYFMNSFFRHYLLYKKAFITKVLNDIVPQEPFPSQLPYIIGFEETTQLNPEEQDLMYPYIVERIFGYTPEEVDIILEDDFMNDIPKEKLQEMKTWREDRQRRLIIDKVMKEKLQGVRKDVDLRMSQQDAEFMEAVNQLKGKKRK